MIILTGFWTTRTTSTLTSWNTICHRPRASESASPSPQRKLQAAVSHEACNKGGDARTSSWTCTISRSMTLVTGTAILFTITYQ